MKWEEQHEAFKEVVDKLNILLTTKGKEYAQGEDCLINFKNGLDIGLRPLQKNFIFLDKHLSSIKSYIKLGKELSEEPIEGRILDAINYLFLMYCLIKEEKNTNTKTIDVL